VFRGGRVAGLWARGSQSKQTQGAAAFGKRQAAPHGLLGTATNDLSFHAECKTNPAEKILEVRQAAKSGFAGLACAAFNGKLEYLLQLTRIRSKCIGRAAPAHEVQERASIPESEAIDHMQSATESALEPGDHRSL